MRPSALLLVAVALAAGAHAQRPADVLANLPPAGADLAVAHYFPKHADKQFPAGDVISVVVSSRNTGSRPLNLSAVVGSLHSPTNLGMHIQNFTVARYLTPLAPGEEAAVEYRFRADPILGATPPRELHLTLHLLYEAGGAFHTATFHNATAEFSEGARLVDLDLIWLVLTLLALGAGSVYGGAQLAGDKLGLAWATGKARKSRRAAEPVRFDSDEWVRGTAYELSKRRKAGGAPARRA